MNTGLTNQWILSIAVISNTILVGTNGGGVFISNNSGSSWKSVQGLMASQQVYCLLVNDGKVFAGTDVGVFQSSDSGNSWVEVNDGLSQQNVYALTVSGSNIFAGTRKGVYKSPLNLNITTGIVNGDLAPLNIYPNPFKNLIRFDCPDNLNVDLLNSDGISIKQCTIINSEIYLSDLAQGVFYLRVSRQNPNQVIKIIKVE
ncbi:MAG TPA: hypothetical protein DGG95_14830 [Cytophagales bacterium]|nr:hypothetical protein [Cytophagales bacterium]